MPDRAPEDKEAEKPFNIVTSDSPSRKFVLGKQSKRDLDKIRSEIIDDRIKPWENRNSSFFNEYEQLSQSWRIQPRARGVRAKKSTGLFNSISGETHRATETLATIWLRMITGADPFFEAFAEGMDDFGNELVPEDLYSVERVIDKQLKASRFEEKLLRWLRSVALFGCGVFEEPYVSLPVGDGAKTIEYTDFCFRSFLQTAFDTSVMDINNSDFMATIDFPTKARLRGWTTADNESWNRKALEDYFKQSNDGTLKNTLNVFDRIQQSKVRAGYQDIDRSVFEFVNYHGILDTNNNVIQNLWESLGRQDDPAFNHFSVGIVDGMIVAKFHETQYGHWRSRFKTSPFKQFEFESLGYGVGRIGKKLQREMDVTQSRINDILMFSLFSMWKLGRFAGLKANALNIKPWNIVELEDISQLEPIRPDINAIAQGLGMQGIKQEEFRNIVNAQSNLQAETKDVSATEAAIAQNEAIRGASVHAKIIAQSIREHISTIHLNNLTYLDNPIWVAATGNSKAGEFDRNNLPVNVGFIIKTILDSDFRPQRGANLLQAIQVRSSIRNPARDTLAIIEALWDEYFRTLSLNPRLIRQGDQSSDMARQLAASAQAAGSGKLANELQGEIASAEGGGGVSTLASPVGPVEGSMNPQGAEGL